MDRPSRLKIGGRVVCINDDFRLLLKYHPGTAVPVKDKEYTVRSLMWVPMKRTYGVLLVEITNPIIITGGFEPNFNEEKFAPIDEVEKAEESIMNQISEIYGKPTEPARKRKQRKTSDL